jgi:hypothetical protein
MVSGAVAQPGAAGPKAAGAPDGVLVTVLAAKVVHNLATGGEQRTLLLLFPIRVSCFGRASVYAWPWGYLFYPGVLSARQRKAAGAPGGVLVTVLAATVVHNLATAGEQRILLLFVLRFLLYLALLSQCMPVGACACC